MNCGKQTLYFFAINCASTPLPECKGFQCHPSFSNPPHFLGGTTNHLLCWRTASILSNVIYLALLFPMQVGAKCSEAVNRPKGKLQPHELPNPAKVYFQSTLGQAKAHAQLKLHHQQCKEPQYRDKCSQFHHVTAGC